MQVMWGFKGLGENMRPIIENQGDKKLGTEATTRFIQGFLATIPKP